MATKLKPVSTEDNKTLGAVMREKYAEDGMFETDVNLGTFKTGFPSLDYGLAFPIDIYDKDVWLQREIQKGILLGSYTVIVGESAVGKSTLAVQLAANIARPYPEAVIDHRDLERSAVRPHVQQISRLPRSDFDISNPNYRYMLSQRPADHETIQKAILRYAREKLSNPKKYTIKLDQRNEFGQEIITMAPTIMIIDSIPFIGNMIEFENGTAKDVKQMEQILSQMDAAQSAGAFKRMMKTVLGPMKQANIIVIGVTWYTEKIQSNPMIHNKKDFRGMDQNKRIAGGSASVYGATNIIGPERRSGKGYTMENGDGYNGFDSLLTLIKTRTTFDAKQIPMIYDCDNGFDAVRSLIQYAIERGIISGNRARMHFTADPECKFSGVNLYEDIKTKPEIATNITKFIISDLEKPFERITPPEHLTSVFIDY